MFIFLQYRIQTDTNRYKQIDRYCMIYTYIQIERKCKNMQIDRKCKDILIDRKCINIQIFKNV